MTNTNVMWESDDIQFARLLAEIRAVGLTPQQSSELSLSMDLGIDDISEILSRAEDRFEAIKQSRATQPAGTAPGKLAGTSSGGFDFVNATSAPLGDCRVCGAPANEPHGDSQNPETGEWSTTCSDLDRDIADDPSQPAGTAPGETLSRAFDSVGVALALNDQSEPPTAAQIIDLIREHRQDALRTAETVTDADRRQGWHSRAAALLELLTEIPGTTEARGLMQAARALDIDF